MHLCLIGMGVIFVVISQVGDIGPMLQRRRASAFSNNNNNKTGNTCAAAVAAAGPRVCE